MTDSPWARAFGRQADADLQAWEFFQTTPAAPVAECHALLFLQMSCEKLCKAHLVRGGAVPESLFGSHRVIASTLVPILRNELLQRGSSGRTLDAFLRDARRLAREIELLNPAVRDGGRRNDNCEYPWEYQGIVRSPLEHAFIPSQLCATRSGRTFMKLLRLAINRNLG